MNDTNPRISRKVYKTKINTRVHTVKLPNNFEDTKHNLFNFGLWKGKTWCHVSKIISNETITKFVHVIYFVFSSVTW